MYCKSLYKTVEIWHHSNFCVAKGDKKIDNPVKNGSLLIPIPNCDEDLSKATRRAWLFSCGREKLVKWYGGGGWWSSTCYKLVCHDWGCEKRSSTTPSLALKIGHSLQKCAKHLRSEGSKDSTMTQSKTFVTPFCKCTKMIGMIIYRAMP
jgi:hypothetical protein